MATLRELCEAVGGELSGPAEFEVTGVASLENGGPADIAPVDSAAFAVPAHDSAAGAFLVQSALEESFARPCIRHDYPLVALNTVMEVLGLVDTTPPVGVHGTAIVEGELGADCWVGPYATVAKGARIGARCRIGAHAVVEGDVVMGDDCRVGHGAIIHDGARLGNRVRVGDTSVVSRQGFGFAPGPKGPVFLHHIGHVVLEDDVNIGAGTMIDRARFDETRVGAMTALDNLIHVGHNARIGARTFVAAQTGLAGRAYIGDDCLVAGQVGIANDCGVGNKSNVRAKSGIIRAHDDEADIFWYPARDRATVLRALAKLFKDV